MEPNSPSVLMAVAEGCEDMEVIVPLSILKRAGIIISIAKVPDPELDDNSLECMLGRGTTIVCDFLIEEAEKSNYEMIIVPGGRPGMDILGKNELLINLLKTQKEGERWICSSSAGSAVILGANGLIDDISVTTYPGFDYLLKRKDGIKKHIVVSEKISK